VHPAAPHEYTSRRVPAAVVPAVRSHLPPCSWQTWPPSTVLHVQHGRGCDFLLPTSAHRYLPHTRPSLPADRPPLLLPTSHRCPALTGAFPILGRPPASVPTQPSAPKLRPGGRGADGRTLPPRRGARPPGRNRFIPFHLELDLPTTDLARCDWPSANILLVPSIKPGTDLDPRAPTRRLGLGPVRTGTPGGW